MSTSLTTAPGNSQSHNYVNDDRFNALLAARMTGKQQKVFVESFKMFLEHGSDDTAFVIDLDKVWGWMGFARKDHAKRLLTKHFNENDHYIIAFPDAKVSTAPTDHSLVAPQLGGALSVQNGGQNKETVLMTVNTFKKLCMRANTAEADNVQNYYVTMEGVLHSYMITCIEESADQADALRQQLEAAVYDGSMERSKALVAAYPKRSLVYAIQMLDLGDYIVVKIGSSDDFPDRFPKITSEFEVNAKVLNVWPCEKNREFEKDLHNHARLLSCQYTDVINPTAVKKTSTETFKIKKTAYNGIKLIIDRSVRKYRTRDAAELALLVREKELQNEADRIKNEANRIKNHAELLKIQSRVADMFQDDPSGFAPALALLTSHEPQQSSIILQNAEQMIHLERD